MTIYNNVFAANVTISDAKRPMIESIRELAAQCLKAKEGMNFENKVVLSIATRLEAERFMAEKINDAKFLSEIKSTQTPRLLKEYKKRFGGESANIATIERVMLMTPENIHLNSFMYEPIIDMSDEHLRKLYSDVSALG
ncbi:hypothetical protein [Bradyrhizobium sp. B039]|uniref:hypothetical protein n=1 Tax=Bradyrhizobium sp. B039 TaxID=3140239 RepID=UPI0031842CDE